jgi:hypothetical protein
LGLLLIQEHGMDEQQIAQDDELQAMVDKSVRNAQIAALHGNTDPLDALWRTVLYEQTPAVKTCLDKLHMALLRPYMG